jgi:hypothetical protein
LVVGSVLLGETRALKVMVEGSDEEVLHLQWEQVPWGKRRPVKP